MSFLYNRVRIANAIVFHLLFLALLAIFHAKENDLMS
jgi:hypothetical protein